MLRIKPSTTLASLQAILLLLFISVSSVQAVEKQKVVYHLSSIDNIGLVLTNAHFHVQGVGGPENVDLIVVVNGAAIKGFTKQNFNPALQGQFDDLKAKGVHFEACGNALQFFKLSVDDLVPGFTPLPQGGVARLGELQMHGYGYIRP